MKKRNAPSEELRRARPPWRYRDVVNVDGIGSGMTVLSVKLGARAWWVEVVNAEHLAWSVPSDRVWS